MALSPDEIERRTFSSSVAGYDPDEVDAFLVEVAATVRLARHATLPPGASVVDPAAARLATPASSDAHVADAPVAKPERAKTESAENESADKRVRDEIVAVRAAAEIDAAAIRAAATEEAEELARQSAADASWQADRAKRVLLTAQDQADAIIAEGEAQARAIILTAREQAEDLAVQASVRTDERADDVLRAERLALSRLQQAHNDVGRAIDRIVRAESVDVRNAPADLRFGLPPAPLAAPEPARALGHAERPIGEPDGVGSTHEPDHASDDEIDSSATARELADRDPQLLMVRHAVRRAVGAAADHAAADPAAADDRDGDLRTTRAGVEPDATASAGSPDVGAITDDALTNSRLG